MAVASAGVSGPFNVLAGLAVSGSTLYVADFGLNLIHRLALPSLSPAGSDINASATPYCVTTDSLGNLYVGYYGIGLIEKFNSSGTSVATLSTGGFVMGIAVDTNGDIYAAEESLGQVQIFPWNGTGYDAVQTITSPLFSGSLRGVLKQGNRLYVSDFSNSVIFQLNETSPHVFGAPQTLNDGGNISNPTQLSTDSAGNLYVASASSSSVAAYAVNSTVNPSQLSLLRACVLDGMGPQGVAVDSQGYLYASASGAPFKVVQIAPCGGTAMMMASKSQNGINMTSTFTPTATPPFSTLAQAAPNVSRNGEPVKFRVNLQQPAQIHLALFTLLGELVYETNFDGKTGLNASTWGLQNNSGSHVASGLYIYIIQARNAAGSLSQSGKVVILQ